jgi:hypothetical protein
VVSRSRAVAALALGTTLWCGCSAFLGIDGDFTVGDGGAPSTGTSAAGSGIAAACTSACCLGAQCDSVDRECVGLVDNAGHARFGLRMAELGVDKPAALSTGIVATIVGGAVALAAPACNLSGSGTFSWLLEIDLEAMTLRTGGAKPVADPLAGYTFVDEVLSGKQVSPILLDLAPLAEDAFATVAGADLVMPIFLDAAATQYVLLPIRDVRVSAAVSPSHNCIGHYNAEGLDPIHACLPDDTHKAFVTGGALSGLITLEDADTIVISSLNETMCVLFANNMGVAGPNGYKVCERDANDKIAFSGDACTAGVGCGDAVTFSADFAASSVAIH